ncbi:hypothetical protein ABZ863_29270 [Saccharomonospora sp. NPDC046836]|uniref:hypothetical protein n=1 Tax=Saccharomonospora sp. NPDC046836 TaxID=3156921 RepID=UPI0033CCD8F2
MSKQFILISAIVCVAAGSLLAISGIPAWIAVAIGMVLVGAIVVVHLRSEGKADRSQ